MGPSCNWVSCSSNANGLRSRVCAYLSRLADLVGAVLAGSPADFRKLIADETEKWGKVVKFSGAKPD